LRYGLLAHDELALGASKLAAMEAGELKRPQYLDQPARLFSKDSPAGKVRSTSAEINEHITETIGSRKHTQLAAILIMSQSADRQLVIPAWMPESSHKDVNLGVAIKPFSNT